MNSENVIRLFEKYSVDLYRFSVSYVGSKHEAEDIVQDVFLKLLTRKIEIGEDYEKRYLMKMTANKCKDSLRASKFKSSIDYDSICESIGISYDFTKENQAVFDAVMNLNEKFRVPVYLHCYEGYMYRDIAKILNISDSAVAMRINRGKEKLRVLLEGF